MQPGCMAALSTHSSLKRIGRHIAAGGEQAAAVASVLALAGIPSGEGLPTQTQRVLL